MTYRHTSHIHGDYLDGDLSPEQRNRVERHLATCDECRQDLEKLKKLTQALQGIEGPDPGKAYFDSLADIVMARTASMTGPELSSKPVTDRHSSGRQVLTTLIKLAAAVTLLFTAFYISDFSHKNHATRWAEHIGQSGYVTTDAAGTDEYMMPLSIGINTLLAPTSETELEENPLPEGAVKE